MALSFMKKRINLITYSRTRNYGGILQAYGLYEYLRQSDYDVSFIDYIPQRCNIQNRKQFVAEAASKSRIWGKNKLTKWMFSIVRYPGIERTFAPFIDFMDAKANFTKPYFSIGELIADTPLADVYITGSDQVWNSQFTAGQELDLPFYLPFVKDSKKISYASSFGRDYVPKDHKEAVSRMLNQYDAISVRERSGQKILNEMGIASTVVVDPTILCPAEVWEHEASQRLGNHYIFLYLISFNKQLYRQAKAMAKKSGKKLITVSLDSRDRKYIHKNLMIAPSINDWLSYIKYADGVITDSFHASVFSILFKKQFLVNSATRKGMSTRINDLLASTGLESRNANTFDLNQAMEMLNDVIDWEFSSKALNSLKEHSSKWLAEAIEGRCGHCG